MSKEVYVWPVRLKSGSSVRTCWVDQPVSEGSLITLKDSGDPKQQWTVVWRGTRMPKNCVTERGWRVGGL